jgi:hypothetical protein
MREREPPKKPPAQEEQERLKDLREMVREDIEEHREFIRKIRMKMH